MGRRALEVELDMVIVVCVYIYILIVKILYSIRDKYNVNIE